MMSSRREFLKQASALALALGLPSSAVFAAASRFTVIRRNVGLYTNSGGTIGWMIRDDATVVVDSQYPEAASEALSGFKERRDAPVDVLFNTHHHGDHTGGNGVMQAKTIIAHERVPELQRQQNARIAPVVADQTFSREWSGTYGDETVTARHFGAAHTGGDAIIHFEKANVVHMGDLVFNRVYPFIDRAGGASIAGWVRVLDTAIRTFDADTVHIFGHGNPNFGVKGGRADLQVMKAYLQALLDHTARGLRSGKSREEITAEVQLPGFEDFISFGPRLSLMANLNAAFDELSPQ
jgi:glyoxylase-like metal-dependent hydrolase (beta-lactamase superfamily II)